jgi:hypothetical protein
MTPEQALVNLKVYYCEEEDSSHEYIRESWQTLKDLVNANKSTSTAKPT